MAVIGGTGFYRFLEQPESRVMTTPYGAPSAAVSVGEVAGRAVAFLPRHGANHEFPPHRINYRANLWALSSLGVRQVLAPCAVGGLRSDVAPGDVVVPDQLVDRTQGRSSTYVETGAVHAPFADPYCPRLVAAVGVRTAQSGSAGPWSSSMGPRFSTRAESLHYATQGWSLVNMTGAPEATLARECGCATARSPWSPIWTRASKRAAASVRKRCSRPSPAVSSAFAVSLALVIQNLPDPTGCSCSSWADELELTYEVP